MIHKDTSLLSYFSLTKRRVQGGVATSERRRRDGVYQKSSKDFPSLENLPASSHFASCKQPSPSGANTLPRPSRYSLAAATGSKRSSADSDLLLCHVRLWRTSRELTDSRKRTRSASPRQGVQIWVRVCVRTWRDKGYFDSLVSAQTLPTPAPPIIQRACRQCVHESARLFRALCSHAWYG